MAVVISPSQIHRRVHRRDKSARELLGVCLAVDPGLDHHKLIAAEPRHRIVGADNRTQAFGDDLEQKITAVVSKGVIDVLEAIKIDKMYGDAAASR